MPVSAFCNLIFSPCSIRRIPSNICLAWLLRMANTLTKNQESSFFAAPSPPPSPSPSPSPSSSSSPSPSLQGLWILASIMNRLAALVSLSRAALRASLLERAPLSSTARSAHTLCAPSTRPSILLPTSTDWALSSRSKSKKSKSSFASNVDEPIEGDPGSVPVLNTKGKGHSKHAKGSSGSPRGAKSKRGDAEQDGGHPDAEEATKTGDRSLEGEMFDVERTRENMKRAVERCRTTLAGMVGMLGRADPGESARFNASVGDIFGCWALVDLAKMLVRWRRFRRVIQGAHARPSPWLKHG